MEEKAKIRCPVCDQAWDEGQPESERVVHLCEVHAWPLKAAISWVKDHEHGLSHMEMQHELTGLREKLKRLYERRAWLLTALRGFPQGRTQSVHDDADKPKDDDS